MSVDVNERVIDLESVLKRSIEHTDQSFERVNGQAKLTKKEVASLSIEMKDFKNEINAEHKKVVKQRGELVNKIGALIEFIFFPRTHFGY